MQCEYIMRYQEGKRCFKKCNSEYCSCHCTKINPLQITLKSFIKESHFQLNNLYLYLQLYDCDVMKEIIDYLCTKDSLIEYEKKYFNLASANTKDTAAKDIWIQIILNYHIKLLKLKTYETHIRTLQINWRKKHSNLMNDVDPFTLEKLVDIPKEELFSYTNKNKQTYTFSAQEFHHHLLTNGLFNPLNREVICSATYDRLKLQLQLQLEKDKKVVIKDFSNPWNTPTQAFLDVLYDYEKFGIYTKIEWFTQLSFDQIINIFILYNTFLCNYELGFFNIEVLTESFNKKNDKDIALIVLAKEMKQLINIDNPMKFFFICSFFFILATIEKRVADGLPSWIWLGANNM